MNIEKPTPKQEREPRFLPLEAITDKMNTFVDTRLERCKKPPQIIRRPDGLVTYVTYDVKNEDGSISVFSYQILTSGRNPADAIITFAYFRGDPANGDWISGRHLADYDGATGQWTDKR